MILCHSCREKLKEQNLVLEKGSANGNADSRHQIDLNRCLTEVESQIDLEAPVTVETNIMVGKISTESICKEPFDSSHEGLIRVAAESLVAISPCQAREMQENAAHELDQERAAFCESNPSFSNVLPGLACLSRNEVTEDLKTFEGSIRAVVGVGSQVEHREMLVRLEGEEGARKRTGTCALSTSSSVLVAIIRPQIDQQPQCGELQGVEDRSLTVTSWGKRTRRPARQRYPITTSVSQE